VPVRAVALAALDMAGTTVADGGAVERSFRRALEAGGGPQSCAVSDPEGFVATTMGQSKLAVFTALFGGDGERAGRANAAFEEAYGEAVAAGEIAPVPGATETMAELRDGGVKVCLTTGFAPVTRRMIMETLGWNEAVDLALSPADAGRGRPWPDMILTAVIRLEIDDVREVAVVGDTTSDLVAGWRAGAGIVAGVLTGAHGRSQLESAPHTHILSSVAELSGLVLH